ncbi:MAG: hypothetical protein E6R04_11540 [Spirochaetes bacterium]|nr:MAG: hypothetical protein E6R04_11540 [Spirochaetota bacterium]
MRSKNLKSPEQELEINQWVKVDSPVPGSLYSLSLHKLGKIPGFPYSHAVVRYVSEDEGKLWEVVQYLSDDMDLAYLRELDYVSSVLDVDLFPKTSNYIFPGEMVFFIETHLSTFHKVLKGEELLLVDGRVFSFLAHHSTLPLSSITI